MPFFSAQAPSSPPFSKLAATGKPAECGLGSQARIERFLRRFSPVGSPSERAMVRVFIDQYLRENGELPEGRHLLRVQTDSFGFLGRWIDYSDLNNSDRPSSQAVAERTAAPQSKDGVVLTAVDNNVLTDDEAGQLTAE